MLASYSLFFSFKDVGICRKHWPNSAKVERSKVTQIVPKHPQNTTVEFILMSYRWGLIKLLAEEMIRTGLFVFPDSSPNLPVSVSWRHLHFFADRSPLGTSKLPPDCASSLMFSPFHSPLPWIFHSARIQHRFLEQQILHNCTFPPPALCCPLCAMSNTRHKGQKVLEAHCFPSDFYPKSACLIVLYRIWSISTHSYKVTPPSKTVLSFLMGSILPTIHRLSLIPSLTVPFPLG